MFVFDDSLFLIMGKLPPATGQLSGIKRDTR